MLRSVGHKSRLASSLGLADLLFLSDFYLSSPSHVAVRLPSTQRLHLRRAPHLFLLHLGHPRGVAMPFARRWRPSRLKLNCYGCSLPRPTVASLVSYLILAFMVFFLPLSTFLIMTISHGSLGSGARDAAASRDRAS
jgi:hypothetical protein